MVKLFLMTKKGYEVLNSLIQNGFAKNIALVVSSEDKNVIKDYYEEIKFLCAQANIKFANRTEKTVNINCKHSIAISWRWLLDEEHLIVFHDSLLPKYRGFSPLVNMLINGEPIIGVTALFANEDYDQGDIIRQSSQEIKYPITIEKAIDLVGQNYIELATYIFNAIVNNEEVVGVKQSNDNASYSLWRDDKDYLIDWTSESNLIARFVDSVGYPFTGAMTTIDDKLVKIVRVIEQEDVHIENRTPGKIIFLKQNKPVVVCGKGLLLIDEMTLIETSQPFICKKFRSRFK